METNSEAYRHACEIRYVATKDKDGRTQFYQLVAKHRGEAAARVLEDAVKAHLLATFPNPTL